MGIDGFDPSSLQVRCFSGVTVPVCSALFMPVRVHHARHACIDVLCICTRIVCSPVVSVRASHHRSRARLAQTW